MLLYLGHKCLCWLRELLWSHISTRMCLLAAEPYSTYCRASIPLSVSLYNDLGDPILDGVYWQVSRAGPMPLYWPSCLLLFLSPIIFPFSYSFYGLELWSWGLWTDRVSITLSQPCIANLNNNNNNNKLSVWVFRCQLTCSYYHPV